MHDLVMRMVSLPQAVSQKEKKQRVDRCRPFERFHANKKPITIDTQNLYT